MLIFCKLAQCDIIPDNSHFVHKCVKIINSADFPDIALVAYSENPGGGPIVLVIDPASCIEKSYKFNKLKIFAVKKEYLANKKLDSIDWMRDRNVFRTNIEIESYGGYVDNLTPIYSIKEYYKIESLENNILVLYKSKEIIKFNNGRPVSIKTYAYKSGITSLDKQNSTNEDPYNYLPGSQYTVLYFLRALFFTILIETFVLFIFFKTKFKTANIDNRRLLLTGFLCSFSTLPYLWYVFPIFIQSILSYVLIGELSVVIVEALIISGILKTNFRNAFLISLVANLASFLTGLLLDRII